MDLGLAYARQELPTLASALRGNFINLGTALRAWPAVEMVTTIPKVRADECIRSVLERVSTLQGASRAQLKWDEAMLMTVESLSAEIVQKLVEANSYMGYLRFVSVKYANVPIHCHADWKSKSGLLRAPRTQQLVCISCINRDMAMEGDCYLRRQHQLVGVEVCNEHGAMLLPRAAGAELWELPSDMPDEVATERALSDAASPVVRRFLRLSELALVNTQPRSPAFMASALVRRARSEGVRVTIEGRGLRLSDVAKDLVPKTWLAKHFPAVHAVEKGTHSPALDDVLRARHVSYRTASYLLAMALLWDDPDQAMEACIEAPESSQQQMGCEGAMRALRGVLSGKTIRAACREQRTTLEAFAKAVRISASNAWSLRDLNSDELTPPVAA